MGLGPRPMDGTGSSYGQPTITHDINIAVDSAPGLPCRCILYLKRWYVPYQRSVWVPPSAYILIFCQTQSTALFISRQFLCYVLHHNPSWVPPLITVSVNICETYSTDLFTTCGTSESAIISSYEGHTFFNISVPARSCAPRIARSVVPGIYLIPEKSSVPYALN